MITDIDLIRSKPRFLQRSDIYLYRDEAKVEKIFKKRFWWYLQLLIASAQFFWIWVWKIIPIPIRLNKNTLGTLNVPKWSKSAIFIILADLSANGIEK